MNRRGAVRVILETAGAGGASAFGWVGEDVVVAVFVGVEVYGDEDDKGAQDELYHLLVDVLAYIRGAMNRGEKMGHTFPDTPAPKNQKLAPEQNTTLNPAARFFVA